MLALVTKEKKKGKKTKPREAGFKAVFRFLQCHQNESFESAYSEDQLHLLTGPLNGHHLNTTKFRAWKSSFSQKFCQMCSCVMLALTWLHIHPDPDHTGLLKQSHPKHMAKIWVVGIYKRNVRYNYH